MRKLLVGAGCLIFCVVAEVISARYAIANYRRYHSHAVAIADVAGMAVILLACLGIYRKEK